VHQLDKDDVTSPEELMKVMKAAVDKHH
jgi:hypothetical protein